MPCVRHIITVVIPMEWFHAAQQEEAIEGHQEEQGYGVTSSSSDKNSLQAYRVCRPENRNEHETETIIAGRRMSPLVHGVHGGNGGLFQRKGLALRPLLEDHGLLVGGLFHRRKHARILGEVRQKGGQAVGIDETDDAHFHSLSWMFFSSSS